MFSVWWCKCHHLRGGGLDGVVASGLPAVPEVLSGPAGSFPVYHCRLRPVRNSHLAIQYPLGFLSFLLAELLWDPPLQHSDTMHTRTITRTLVHVCFLIFMLVFHHRL
jgi:hypothetical protein